MTESRTFAGWHVVGAAFTLALFGWGVGFYGPPVYLQAVRDTHGWALSLVSAAVTVHFLFGAAIVATLPRLYARYGLPAVTKAGGLCLAAGVTGWAAAAAPWQLFAAALVSGAGWAALGAAAVNAIVAPWFVRARPAALAMAYNGASIGGVVFSPLWVAAIALIGFRAAAAVIGLVTVVMVWALAERWFTAAPHQLGQSPDGDAAGAPRPAVTSSAARPLPGARLWRDRGFLTLAAGMALGLFAQIGLLSQLFSLLAPTLGPQLAGVALGGATAAAIAGRTVVGWLMPAAADRRVVAGASYAVQIAGTVAFLAAGGTDVLLLLLGLALFGAGIGNATSLPPLIAQVEFVGRDAPRAVALIVAISQAAYALAPATFGLIREFSAGGGAATPQLYLTAAVIQAAAVAMLLIGRPGRQSPRRRPAVPI